MVRDMHTVVSFLPKHSTALNEQMFSYTLAVELARETGDEVAYQAYRQAGERLAESRMQNPGRGNYLPVAVFYETIGQVAEAAKAYGLHPNIGPNIYTARFLFGQGDIAAAKKELEEIENQDDGWLHSLILAESPDTRVDVKDALLSELNDPDASPVDVIGRLYEIGYSDAGMRAANQCIARQQSLNQEVDVWLYYQAGNIDEVQLLSKLAEGRKQRAWSYWRIAQTCLGRHQRSKAIEYLHKCERLTTGTYASRGLARRTLFRL